MSYHIYNTEGFVIDSAPYGEANRLYYILTKDFGLIVASAQGVRLLKSKLRYALQPYAYCRFAFVRGKEMWRVTSVDYLDSVYESFSRSRGALQIFSRVFALLKRLLPGEEENKYLYESVAESFFYAKIAPPESIKDLEYLLVARILHALGYLSGSGELELFIQSPFINEDLLRKAGAVRSRVALEINKSLRESHL